MISYFNKSPKQKIYREYGSLWKGKCSCGWKARFTCCDEYDPDAEFTWAREKHQVQAAIDEHCRIDHSEPLLDLANIMQTYEV